MSWNGDILRMTRRAAGLTQDDLIRRAGLDITQAALSRYESSLREPDSEDILERIASALEVTTEFLRAGERTFPMVSVSAHMRRQKSVPPTVWKDLEAQLNLDRVHWHLLMRGIDLKPRLHFPIYDVADMSPEQAARLVREAWQLPIGPVESLVGWLEAAGAVVSADDFGTQRVDGMSQWIGDFPIISLNKAAPNDRKRLTLAHELGHLVLHSDAPSLDAEVEANAFAAEFLMPEVEIAPELRSGSLTLGKLRSLKLKWGTSMQAIFERAYTLGIVDTDQRKAFYRQLSARGWKTVEPDSDLVEIDEPRLREHVAGLLEKKGLDRQEIAKMAGYGPSGVALLFPKRVVSRRHLTAV